MAKLGSTKRPIIVRVQTEEKLDEVAAICNEKGWHFIAGLEPYKPEDLADLERALNPPAIVRATNMVGRNDPCPCGSGRKYKQCCMRADSESASVSKKEPPSSRVLVREQVNIEQEAEYIVEQARAGSACIVTLGPLVFFSTESRDAWVLDPEDGYALCLAQDGESRSVVIRETGSHFGIGWDKDYRIEGDRFTVVERSGKRREIFGYPTKEIEKAIRRKE